MDRFIHIITHWPKTVVIFILLATIPFGYAFFHRSFLNNVKQFFDPDDHSMVVYEQFQETYGNEEIAIIALRADNLFTNPLIDVIRQISNVALSTYGVQRVFSLTEATIAKGTEDAIEFQRLVPEGRLTRAELERVRQRALTDEIVNQSILSKSGTATAILIELAPAASAEEKGRILNDIASKARVIAGQTVQLHFSGTPYVEYEINALTQRDDKIFTPITLAVIFLLSAIFLKDISLSILCLLNIIFTVVWSVGLFVLSGQTFNIVTVVIPPVLLAISVADGIHILSHFKTLYANSNISRLEAVTGTIRKLWLPCLFTSLTTAAGFLSFLTTDVGPVRSLGLYTAIGVMIALAITITAIPALLILLPLRQPPIHPESAGGSLQNPPSSTPYIERAMLYIGNVIIRHYKASAFFFTIVTIIALAGAYQLRYETNFANHLSETNSIKQGIRFIEKNLFGTVPIVLLVRADSKEKDFTHPESLALIDQIETGLKKEFNGYFTSFFSIADYLKTIHRAFNQGGDDYYAIPGNRLEIQDYYELAETDVLYHILSPDKMEARISFNAFLGPIDRSKRLAHYLASYVSDLIGKEYTYEVTGTSTLYVAMDRNLQASQSRSFTSAFVIVFFMMFLICRSWKLTLISIVPNIFPIVCTFGLMGYLDIPLDVATILIASVTIGIAVDDTIHFMVFYRRHQAQGLPVKSALLKTYEVAGRPIMVTSFMLSFSFIIFLTASVKPVQMFGMLASLAMLFALVGDLFILPTLIMIFKPDLQRKAALKPIKAYPLMIGKRLKAYHLRHNPQK